MRSFMTTIYAAGLLLCLVPCAAESIDTDVQAARAAERAESIRLEQQFDEPVQPVALTVTEIAHEEGSGPSAGSESPVASPRDTSAKTSNKLSSTPGSSGASSRSDATDSTDQSAAKPVVEPRHADRPDKVALMFGAEKSDGADARQSGSLAPVVSTILKLVVVLVLAYLTILALKWFSSRHEVSPSNHRQFRMVDTFRFNSTSSLHLVEVKGTTLLLGCTSGQVNLLREFNEDETGEVDPEPSGKFAEYLARYSDESRKHGPSGRIAGMLRDCSSYLRGRCHGVRTGARNEK